MVLVNDPCLTLSPLGEKICADLLLSLFPFHQSHLGLPYTPLIFKVVL